MNRHWIAGILLVLVGAAIGVVPFALPAVDPDLGSGPAGAWDWTEDRAVRQVAAGAAVAVGGLLLLVRRRWVGVIGSLLATAGGAWLVAAPAVLGEVGVAGSPETAETVRDLAHAAGVGVVALLGAGFMLGRLWQLWRFERTPIPLPSQAPATAHDPGPERVARGRPW